MVDLNTLKGVRFCVASEILGLFPDSILMSLFPTGLIAFYPAPPERAPFHCCSQIPNASQSGSVIGPESAWLSGVEDYRLVQVDFDPYLFNYLICSFREFLEVNNAARDDPSSTAWLPEPTSVGHNGQTSSPTDSKANGSSAAIDTVLVLREELEYFVIHEGRKSVRPRPSSRCDEDERPRKGAKSWNNVIGAFRKIFPFGKKRNDDITPSTPQPEPTEPLTQQSPEQSESAETILAHPEDGSPSEVDLDGKTEAIALDDISIRSIHSVKSHTPSFIKRFCGEHLSTWRLISALYGEAAFSMVKESIVNTPSNEAPDKQTEDAIQAHSESTETVVEEETPPENTLQHEHLVEALELLSDFEKNRSVWGHRSYDPVKSKIVSVALMRSKPTDPSKSVEAAVVENSPAVTRNSETNDEELVSADSPITQVKDEMGECNTSLSVPGLAQHLAAKMPVRKCWWETVVVPTPPKGGAFDTSAIAEKLSSQGAPVSDAASGTGLPPAVPQRKGSTVSMLGERMSLTRVAIKKAFTKSHKNCGPGKDFVKVWVRRTFRNISPNVWQSCNVKGSPAIIVLSTSVN
ncbi:hypothetical protein HDU97_004754 [Phlyctochytrium planicorne]|nr:hypothetical protein HDU97_004754 [Phlyctochytrium planicorne]